ncbi:MAG: OmpA family protein [Flavobacteriales bacterium]|nr:OmpA family protein [Flavobacteriales bacterium]
MKKRTYYTLLLFLAAALMFSCSSKYLVKGGSNDYENLRYADAIEKFSSALEKDPENEEAMKMLARSYERVHKYSDSKKYYEMFVAKGNAEPADKFEYAKMLMSSDEHDKAELYIREYLQTNTDDKVAHSLLEACQFIEFFKDDTALYQMEKLPIFTNLSMFSPVPYKDGIAFTAERIAEGAAENPWTNNSYYDIYYAVKRDGAWGTQIPFDLNINGKFHEGPITFNGDGTKAIFTRSSNFNDNKKQALDEDDFNNLFLYEAELIDGNWTNITELPFNDKSYSCMHPTLSPDGSMLFFSSDMPGGIGKNDLYISTHNGQQWTDPVNLGDKLNTPEDEVFPVLRGNELFFASDGLPSLGGLDMFVSDFEDNAWNKPRNMNYPLNSTSDDFSMILLDGDTTGYFASNREGIDRIYQYVKKPSGRVYIDGTAREEETGEVLSNVKVVLKNNVTGEVLREIITDEEGKFDLVLLPERMYKIEGIKEGYFRESYERSTINQYYDEEVELLFSMAEIVTVGEDPLKRYALNKIYYDLNDHRIRQDAALELNKLVTILQDNPTLNIRILSHTDSRASDEYNMDLSERRAQSVVDYLEQKGISVDRLESKGMGETQLINECVNGATCSDAKHEENRRTEFVVTKY